MKRLTYRLEDQYGNPTDSIILESDLIFLNSSEKWKKVLSRLAAIEDILGDEYDLDRLRELAEADREGRCVVLPVKSGTTVYYLGASMCKWRELDKCDEYCDGWQYKDCYEGEQAVLEKKFSISDLPCIGKTVFLTREDAQAALRREQE